MSLFYGVFPKGKCEELSLNLISTFLRTELGLIFLFFSQLKPKITKKYFDFFQNARFSLFVKAMPGGLIMPHQTRNVLANKDTISNKGYQFKYAPDVDNLFC
jgi:hypothetical protein